MCLYPKLINNKKYIANKKNGGKIPPLPIINGKEDKRVLLVPVGCGKCMECMKKKAREWQVRLLEDVRHEKNGIFVTLTFSNEEYTKLSNEIKLEGYELDNEIAKLATRRFLERWRKKYKKSVRHWLVTELGHNGTENIHVHGIIWTNIDRNEINRIWGYGYTWMPSEGNGWVNEQTVNYITKYIHKIDEQHKEYKPIILTSSGIGKGYLNREDSKLNKYKKNVETKTTYTNRQGYKMGLPTYWRNKIYTEEEKEKLWIEMLDKEERYVLGKKISIKDNEELYERTRDTARLINKKLGYGDDKKNWDRIRYERQRRILKQNKRKGK